MMATERIALSNGTLADADDVTANLNAVAFRGDSNTEDTTEYTHTGDTNYTTVKSYRFTPSLAPIVVLGFKLQADIKISNAANSVGVRLSTLGQTITATTHTGDTNYTTETLYTGIDFNVPINSGSTFDTALQINTSVGGETAYVKNITITVYYLDNITSATNDKLVGV